MPRWTCPQPHLEGFTEGVISSTDGEVRELGEWCKLLLNRHHQAKSGNQMKLSFDPPNSTIHLPCEGAGTNINRLESQKGEVLPQKWNCLGRRVPRMLPVQLTSSQPGPLRACNWDLPQPAPAPVCLRLSRTTTLFSGPECSRISTASTFHGWLAGAGA